MAERAAWVEETGFGSQDNPSKGSQESQRCLMSLQGLTTPVRRMCTPHARGTRPVFCLTLMIAFASMHGGSLREVSAQETVWSLDQGLPAGSELEQYLRVLQLAGVSPWVPWTIRGFTPGELSRLDPGDAEHPWLKHVDLSVEGREAPPTDGIPLETGLYLNSGFPHGDNDGALWAGRGVSVRGSAGVAIRWDRLHLRLAPEVWWSQNAGFELTDNGLVDDGAFRDPMQPYAIDLPQRFGSSAVGGLSLGSTQISVALPGITAGASGASQSWGPGNRYQLLMGTNAGGIPHLFLQTSGPLHIGVGRLSARMILGKLGQSSWSPVQDGETRRFLSGAVVTFEIGRAHV